MLLNVILFVGMYPVIFILYFVLRWSAKNRNGTVFGLCVPKEKAFAEKFFWQVDQMQAWYQSRMRTILAIFAILPFFSFMVPYVSIQLTFWLVWMFAGIVCMELPVIQVNRELRIWKKETQAKMLLEGQAEGEDQKKTDTPKPDNVKLVELSEAGQVRKTKPLLFLIPTLFSAAAVILHYLQSGSRGRQMTWVVLLFALCTPMFYAAAGWMDRQRTAVVSYDSEINLNYARAKKQIWSRLWLACAWINTAFTIFSAFTLRNEKISVLWLLLGTIVYMALTLLCLLFSVWKASRLEARYEKKIDPLLNEDDDDCWKWGVFYYNKADKRTLVETRIGYGTATNFATPLGKGLLAFSAVAILSVPVLCIWLILVEFTPIKLDVKEDYLVAEQLKTDYRIAVFDITGLEIVDHLPELSKNAGTGMENLYKGNWHIVYAGNCEVFLNPQNKLFLKFTAGGKLYYMSAAGDAKTREVYEELAGRVE